MNNWLERKRKAADLFVSHLLESPARPHIAKVLLHGSVAEGVARPESDVDVIVFQIGAPELVADVCDEASFQVVMEAVESVEPLIFPVDEYRHPTSYFIYRAIQDGEVLYSMEEKALQQEEIERLYELGVEYLEDAGKLEELGRYRGAVDLAYNAAELAVKGLIFLKSERLPKTHGGVVNRFGELYIKSGVLPTSLSKRLRRGFRYRNLARYVPSATIGAEEARQTIQVADELLTFLEAEKS
nr:HEPN domain-containing protein [Anaerolineae bacterium]